MRREGVERLTQSGFSDSSTRRLGEIILDFAGQGIAIEIGLIFTSGFALILLQNCKTNKNHPK